MTPRDADLIYEDLKAKAIKAYYNGSILVVEKLPIEELIALTESQGSKAMFIDVTGGEFSNDASGIELKFGPVTVHAITERPTPSGAV